MGETRIKVGPQSGPQFDFISSPASICIYGGSAGSGKTWGGLYDFLRNSKHPGFQGVAFRRIAEDITKPGALWDTAADLYPLFQGRGNKSELEWIFPSGAKLTMAGMKDEKDREKWQGTAVPYIYFDEGTQFLASQFWYMPSRNRSTTGIPGRMRMGCNPDPDSFVRELIDWWIGKDGFPIMARAGIVRWFIRRGFNLEWADTKEDLIKRFGTDQEPKSLTFIPSTIYHNRILMEKDPGYISNLKALNYVDRMQLLEGNWNVRAIAGSYFKREYFGLPIEAVPTAGIVKRVRFYDRAASEISTMNPHPDATVGILMCKDGAGRFYVEHMERIHASPYMVERKILELAERDGKHTQIGWMQDPGSAGVKESQDLAFKLAGYSFQFEPSNKSKETRAKPLSSQCQAGNVKILRGAWNDDFFRELEGFPDGPHDDIVDAFSGAFNMLLTGAAATPITPREREFSLERMSSRMAF